MFQKIWLRFLGWLIKTHLYNFLLLKVIPYIRFTTYYALPENTEYQKWGALCSQGYEVLKPGDVILTVDDKKLTTKFISMFTGKEGFSHAAFCVSKNGNYEIAEMTHSHFTKSTWTDICYESTRVLILRSPLFDDEYIKKMIEKTKDFESLPYDTSFKLGIESLSCAELVYVTDFEQRLDVNLEPILGRDPYISPMGLYECKNLIAIWDSNEIKRKLNV